MTYLNLATAKVREFHGATKHSYMSLRIDHHYLDWENKPILYKVYLGLPTKPLPLSQPLAQRASLQAVADYQNATRAGELALQTLAEFLYLSAGLTKVVKWGSEDYYHRAASCAGALYPIELYLVTGEMQSLQAGVYHFCPGDFSLRKLREGDYRAYLASLTADAERVSSSSAIIIFTAIFWRSAWKYRARSYRYCYWDCGTILANLLAACSQFKPKLITGFIDDQLSSLLGLDPEKEAALGMLAIGTSTHSQVGPINSEQLQYPFIPLSHNEVEYKSIVEVHALSRLETQARLQSWSPTHRLHQESENAGDRSIHLQPFPHQDSSTMSLGETVLRRGSTRRFARQPIRFTELSTILDGSARGVPADFLHGPEDSLVDIYLIINSVESISPGAYYHDRLGKKLVLLREGSFRGESGYLCLQQELAADASIVVYFMVDLDRVLERFGNRGYRVAHLEAGILGGKMYLCAYAQGLGATGLTFFDDDVTEFFSPHGKSKNCLFVVALGVPDYKTHRIPWSKVPLQDPIVDRLLSERRP
jgi:SagB-type dehydrogenase family enzyme